MISAQDLIEKILSKATCDDCIVVVKEKSQANKTKRTKLCPRILRGKEN